MDEERTARIMAARPMRRAFMDGEQRLGKGRTLAEGGKTLCRHRWGVLLVGIHQYATCTHCQRRRIRRVGEIGPGLGHDLRWLRGLHDDPGTQHWADPAEMGTSTAPSVEPMPPVLASLPQHQTMTSLGEQLARRRAFKGAP